MSFDNIIGNEKIKQLLEKSVKEHNILHSYLFVGQDGIGKSLFAEAFAKLILCTSLDSCNTCKSCISFDSQNHPDFLVIRSEDCKSIKIEQIRYLQEKISEKPIVSNRKVYVILDSDLMTKEAQNCLLKTLEEPPEYATIILVLSNESKLLTTIKSRCTKIHFSNLKREEVLSYFHNETLSETILKICNGSIGKAIRLKDEISTYSELEHILDLLQRQDIIEVWNRSELLYQSKDNINDLLEYMNIYFMNQLRIYPNEKYINCIKTIEQTKTRLASNANYDMCIDTILLQIWEELNEKYNRS